jgi:hypothetical protein
VRALVHDQRRLDFDLAGGRVAVGRIRAGGDIADAAPLVRAAELCGLDLAGHDPRGTVARALGVSAGEVTAALTKRGDSLLADLLLEPTEDVAMSAALQEFGDMLENLDS